MLVLLVGLLGFHLLHALKTIAPGWRSAQIARLGDGPWRGLFSLATFLALALIIWGYASANDAPDIYDPPDWGRAVAFVFTLVAFILMTFNMRSSRLAPITRHPFLLAVILWSAAHLFMRGDLASLLLFGSFLVWSVWAYWIANRRSDPTPPVAPLVQDIAAVMVGVLIWAAFVFFLHGWLFGHPLAS